MFEERSARRAARRRDALGRHDSEYKAQRGRNKCAPLRNFREKTVWEEQNKQGKQRWVGMVSEREALGTDCAGLQALENDASGGMLSGNILEMGCGGCALKSPL